MNFACRFAYINRIDTRLVCFKMRQTYSTSRNSEQLFRAALNNDLGIHHSQSHNMIGFGIGGLLKNIFKRVIPIGKSLFKHGLEVAKPELRKLATKGINAAGNYAIKGVESAVSSANTKVGVKRRKMRSKRRKVNTKVRKRDTLS